MVGIFTIKILDGQGEIDVRFKGWNLIQGIGPSEIRFAVTIVNFTG